MNDASIATLQAAILAAHRTRFAGQDGLPAQPTPAVFWITSAAALAVTALAFVAMLRRCLLPGTGGWRG